MFAKGAQVVFAFSDAAGANACLAQAYILQKENLCTVSCFSNKPVASKHWAVPVQVKQELTETDLQDAKVLFTGTSHADTSGHFELHAIRLARKKGIHTIAFVDHWTSISIRFNLKTETIYPHEIWVPDETAKEMAIKEGIPEELIEVKKNPYLVYLSAHWKSIYPHRTYRKNFAVPLEKKIIVIAPDPISLRLKDFNPGFTETTALEDLLTVLDQTGAYQDSAILLKAHPLQPIETLHAVLHRHANLSVKIVTDSDNPELINIADLVIGFYSNFLLEANAMGKPVLRYFPGNAAVDPFKHLAPLPAISNRSQALLSLQAIL